MTTIKVLLGSSLVLVTEMITPLAMVTHSDPLLSKYRFVVSLPAPPGDMVVVSGDHD
jgi:hypothetical protein